MNRKFSKQEIRFLSEVLPKDKDTARVVKHIRKMYVAGKTFSYILAHSGYNSISGIRYWCELKEYKRIHAMYKKR